MENLEKIIEEYSCSYDCSKMLCQRLSFNICSNVIKKSNINDFSSIINIGNSFANKGKKNENELFEQQCEKCIWCSQKGN